VLGSLSSRERQGRHVPTDRRSTQHVCECSSIGEYRQQPCDVPAASVSTIALTFSPCGYVSVDLCRYLCIISSHPVSSPLLTVLQLHLQELVGLLTRGSQHLCLRLKIRKITTEVEWPLPHWFVLVLLLHCPPAPELICSTVIMPSLSAWQVAFNPGRVNELVSASKADPQGGEMIVWDHVVSVPRRAQFLYCVCPSRLMQR
jgi:hypothetical protein